MNNNLCWILILLSCCGCGCGNGSTRGAIGDCGCGNAMPFSNNNCCNDAVANSNSGCGCNDILWLIILICLFSSCKSNNCGNSCSF